VIALTILFGAIPEKSLNPVGDIRRRERIGAFAIKALPRSPPLPPGRRAKVIGFVHFSQKGRDCFMGSMYGMLLEMSERTVLAGTTI
jgi:hypothetical protein